MSSSPGYIADFDSASAMVRALARHLEGRGFPDLGNPRALRPLAIATNALPLAARQIVNRTTFWSGRNSGHQWPISPAALSTVDTGDDAPPFSATTWRGALQPGE